MIGNKDLDALEDIIYCIDLIHQYMEGLSKEEFYINQEKQDVLVHRLEIMGEASKRLSNDITDIFTDIPWKQIKGMRDVLIHQYDDIMLEIVWETVKKRIPEIEQKLREINKIVDKILKIKKELTELVTEEKEVLILKKQNNYNSFVLISNILKEEGIEFKLINSIEQIKFNKGQEQIIFLHFGTFGTIDNVNENIKMINLSE